MPKKVNWKVRFSNKLWLASFISQTLLLVQALILGLESLHVIDWNLETVDSWIMWLLGFSDLVLAYLAFVGVIIDPTVEGFGDSTVALEREQPSSKGVK